MKPEKGRLCTDEDLDRLTGQWISHWTRAIKAGDSKAVPNFFHPDAVIIGLGGQREFGALLGQAIEFNLQDAHFHTFQFSSLLVVDLKVGSHLNGQPKGFHATFVLMLQPGSKKGRFVFQCFHAHFSATAQILLPAHLSVN